MNDTEKMTLAVNVAAEALSSIRWRDVADQAQRAGLPVPAMEEIDEIRALVSKARVEL